MTNFESLRMQGVQSPIIPIVGDLIRQNPGTISLGQGVVSYGPPPEAIEQISHFLADPNHHKYQAIEGIPALRKAIETKLETENGIAMNADRQVVVTAGSNMGFMNAVMAIADPGDEIILQVPYYFNHEMAVQMANCVPIYVPTDDQYQLQIEAIQAAITPRTKAIVTISPNNPTGVVYPEAALRVVNELCRQNGIYHIHDAAYEYFLYRDDDSRSISSRQPHFSPGAIDQSEAHTICLFSLSKAYGFASWRIGYMVLPSHLLPAVRKIQDTILICAPVISQYAAVGALQAGIGYCHSHLSSIAQVRQRCLDQFATIQDICTVPPAFGAFYFLLKVHTDLDPMRLTEALIKDHQVAVLPGMTFGMHEGCYLRVGYGALQPETVQEGMGRLLQGLRSIVGNRIHRLEV